MFQVLLNKVIRGASLYPENICYLAPALLLRPFIVCPMNENLFNIDVLLRPFTFLYSKLLLCFLLTYCEFTFTYLVGLHQFFFILLSETKSEYLNIYNLLIRISSTLLIIFTSLQKFWACELKNSLKLK